MDCNHFLNAHGGNNNYKIWFGWRRHEATSNEIMPGNMIQSIDNAMTDQVARIYREGLGTNRQEYTSFYAGDTFSRGRLTIDAGLRFDRQTGSALPSVTKPNTEFPSLVPGIEFAGYDAPFTWNTLHPRLGVTWALDARTILRGNFSRYAGQLDETIVGFSNPSSNAGYVDYPWEDRNGGLFAQGSEVRLDRGFIAPGGGFNPLDPASVTSSDTIDPGLKPPVTTGFVLGIERELAPHLALQVNYSWSRSSDYVGLNGAADRCG
jgi:hypothetical protein